MLAKPLKRGTFMSKTGMMTSALERKRETAVSLGTVLQDVLSEGQRSIEVILLEVGEDRPTATPGHRIWLSGGCTSAQGLKREVLQPSPTSAFLLHSLPVKALVPRSPASLQVCLPV